MSTCLYCEKELFGRSDKKYCNDYCKSAFNYEKNKNKPLTRFKVVDNQLKKNYRLLKKYNKAGKSTIRKGILIKEGFNPRIFTNYWKNKSGDVYLFCYDFGFLERKENGKPKYVLIQWQDYMNQSEVI